jgi:hypothetical protein
MKVLRDVVDMSVALVVILGDSITGCGAVGLPGLVGRSVGLPFRGIARADWCTFGLAFSA